LKYDMGIFSIVYPNLHQKENFTIQNWCSSIKEQWPSVSPPLYQKI
jgi:hypothetical protein